MTEREYGIFHYDTCTTPLLLLLLYTNTDFYFDDSRLNRFTENFAKSTLIIPLFPTMIIFELEVVVIMHIWKKEKSYV